MPHDYNGILLSVGDKVVIRAYVESISTGDEYCNVTLKTTEKMFPGDSQTTIVLNGKQVIKAPIQVVYGDNPAESDTTTSSNQ